MAPVALLRQWEREIHVCVKPEYELSVYINHGSTGRKKLQLFSEFSDYDVVLTTYGTLSREYKTHFGYEDPKGLRSIKPNYKSPFFRDAKWFRVILDEAQFIKNRATLACKSCTALNAEYRWCLSGTPMQNNVFELNSLIQFLRIKPYDNPVRFNKEIGVPLQKSPGDKKAMQRLQTLLKATMLRRTKNSMIDGKPILQLPPKNIEIETAMMDEDETEFYRALEAGAQAELNKYINQGTVMKNYSNVLVLLLRLRQACCHPKLIERAHRLKALKMISARSNRNAVHMCRKLNAQIVERLKNQHNFTCPKCMDAVDRMDVVLIYPCGHFICSDCCENFFDTVGDESGKPYADCPTCKKMVNEKELIDFLIFDYVHIELWTDQQIMNSRQQERRRATQSTNAMLRKKFGQPLAGPAAEESSAGDSDSDEDLFMFKDEKPKKPKVEDENDTQVDDNFPFENEAKVKGEQPEVVGPVKGEEPVSNGLIPKTEPTDSNVNIPLEHKVKGEQPEVLGPVKGEPLEPVSNGLAPKTEAADLGNNFLLPKKEEPDVKQNGLLSNAETTLTPKTEQVDLGSNTLSAVNEGTSLAPKKEEGMEEGTSLAPKKEEGIEEGNTLSPKREEGVEDNMLSSLSETNKFVNNGADNATGNIEDNTPLLKRDLTKLFPNGWISSTKIEKCLILIEEVRQKFPGEKVIVFSQFTSLLDFVEVALELANKPNFLRYDGSMNSNARNECIIDFYDKAEMDVLLISLKAGNVGLTLTCASHVIIMDPFWNPFVEDQAMDRAHRIGQRKEVYVHRIVLEGTVEDRILDLQKKKKELIEGALDENGLQSISKLNQKELLFLFGLGDNNRRRH